MSEALHWTPTSWQARPIKQQPSYEDQGKLETTLRRLEELPPLVFSGEIEHLKKLLGTVHDGQAFLLHGGDCAERFDECQSDIIVRKLKILLQMSLVLAYGARKPVVRIGRIAGQFAKPRSEDQEEISGQRMATYRGDLINDLTPDPDARRPDPQRLVQAYFHSAASLNFIRALIDGGFTDLRHPEHWQLDFMAGTSRRGAYEGIAERIRDAIDFFESLGMSSAITDPIAFFTSHEGLHLPYEAAFTRQPPRREHFYNLGAHLLWIGDRTRELDGAHIEYFRGIANPIAAKIGPTCPPEELIRLVEVLNPDREKGRLTLITRYGAGSIEAHLPGHIEAVRSTNVPVIWSSDPMHGNTSKTKTGIKTRSFDDILLELRRAFEIHERMGSRLGGLHFELTGDDVTECVGGAQGLSETDLSRAYATGCDPRLNYAQSLEMAFLAADLLKNT